MANEDGDGDEDVYQDGQEQKHFEVWSEGEEWIRSDIVSPAIVQFEEDWQRRDNEWRRGRLTSAEEL